MSDELAIVMRHAQDLPFDAEGCVRALGIDLKRAPILSAIECDFERRGKNTIFIASRLDTMPAHSRRYAICVAIAHYLLHRDLMWGTFHGDGLFKGFQSTGTALSRHHEAQAHRLAASMLAPRAAIDAIRRTASSETEIVDLMMDKFDIPRKAAEIFLAQANEDKPRRAGKTDR